MNIRAGHIVINWVHRRVSADEKWCEQCCWWLMDTMIEADTVNGQTPRQQVRAETWYFLGTRISVTVDDIHMNIIGQRTVELRRARNPSDW